ncbi:MAG: gamma-glutamyltransferase family protein [Desulfurococcaceae archaeon]
MVKLAVGNKGVVSDHPLATLVGCRILEEGGNAFDAAIAVSAVLSVVQPHMGGPGGDAFLLGFVGDEVLAYMSSGRSPSGFNAEEFVRVAPTRGPLTVTVPGLVGLWNTIYETYATMPLETLLKPAIKLAYSGFRVGWSLAEASQAFEAELSQYRWSKYFKGLKLGNLYKNLEMASTLRILASRGFDEFYYGELAEKVVTDLIDQGVNIGLDDLMEHEVRKVSPLSLELDNIKLYELPPNTQGLSTLQLISALYELELYKYDFNSPERIIAWSEPTKHVYEFRDTHLGDPDYVKIDPQSYVRYSSITKKAPVEDSSLSNELKSSDTTFFIVSDGEALIGFIQSLFYGFGSGLVAAGFPVQNRAIGFAKRFGLPNSPAPKKLPLHTLSVLGVDVGKEKYIIGCVGGDLRPQLHLRIFENIFIYRMHIAKATSAPRFVYTSFETVPEVIVEAPLKLPVTTSIRAKSVEYYGSKGHVHVGIIDKQGRLELACDPRSEGIAQAIQ